MKLVFCTTNHNYESYNSFSKIQNCLPDNFIRCHKSYIINVNNVKKFNTTDNTVMFEKECVCLVGAKYKNKLLEVFKNGNISNNMDRINE